jgi:hypothetical protein
LKKLPPFLDAWSDSSSPTFIFFPAQKLKSWYLECKKTWQPDEEAALKIRLSGREPPSQSDEVVLLESELQEVDEIVGTLDEPNTQKSKRRKRATQDESSLKKRAKKLKIVEDDPPPHVSPEAAVASPPTLSQVPTLSRPPPPSIFSSVRRSPVVFEFMLNSSIVHQRRHFHEISNFIISLPPSHSKRALGIARLNVGMANLVIANISENMPYPMFPILPIMYLPGMH